MSITALFSIDTIQDLSIKLIDKSIGVINNWAWKVESLTLGSSYVIINNNTQNPVIDFIAGEKFKITLTVTGEDLTISQISKEIIVYESNSWGFSIEQMIRTDLVASFNNDFANQDTKNWQLNLYLYASIDSGFIYDESKWPIAWNILISKIVEYDLILDAYQSYLMVTTSLNPLTGTLPQIVKAIELGPSRTEFQDLSSFWKDVLGSGTNNILALIKQNMCMYSSKLKIRLPMCTYSSSTLFNIVNYGCNSYLPKIIERG